MFKKTLILLLSSFIGITASPDFLIASENIEVVGLNNSKIVETVIIPEPVYVAPARVYTAPANHIDIAGRSIRVEYTNSTAVDAGNVVKFYNNKFLYGHNSYNVFGFLPFVGIGQTFSVSYNGAVTNYRVSNKVEYAKTGDTTLGIGDVTYKMGHVANGFDPSETRHSLVIMTCSGTPLGRGDATHRLVLFADAI